MSTSALMTLYAFSAVRRNSSPYFSFAASTRGLAMLSEDRLQLSRNASSRVTILIDSNGVWHQAHLQWAQPRLFRQAYIIGETITCSCGISTSPFSLRVELVCRVLMHTSFAGWSLVGPSFAARRALQRSAQKNIQMFWKRSRS